MVGRDDENISKLSKERQRAVFQIFNGSGVYGSKLQEEQCPDYRGGASHHHRPKVLEMVRPAIGCYIGNNSNKIPSHQQGWNSTD